MRVVGRRLNLKERDLMVGGKRIPHFVGPIDIGMSLPLSPIHSI